jgi:hypothetical protein
MFTALAALTALAILLQAVLAGQLPALVGAFAAAALTLAAASPALAYGPANRRTPRHPAGRF